MKHFIFLFVSLFTLAGCFGGGAWDSDDDDSAEEPTSDGEICADRGGIWIAQMYYQDVNGNACLDWWEADDVTEDLWTRRHYCNDGSWWEPAIPADLAFLRYPQDNCEEEGDDDDDATDDPGTKIDDEVCDDDLDNDGDGDTDCDDDECAETVWCEDEGDDDDDDDDDDGAPSGDCTFGINWDHNVVNGYDIDLMVSVDGNGWTSIASPSGFTNEVYGEFDMTPGIHTVTMQSPIRGQGVAQGQEWMAYNAGGTSANIRGDFEDQNGDEIDIYPVWNGVGGEPVDNDGDGDFNENQSGGDSVPSTAGFNAQFLVEISASCAISYP